MSAAYKRILSVQSHVVSGYVGNKAAVFPLQLLGFEVSPINTVQFSNHTGYPNRTGTVMNGDELADVVAGLQANGLLSQHSHLLTGFIGSVSFLEGVVQLLKKMRAEGPGVRHVCDPVLGDNGRLYVPEELIALYKDCIVPNANLLTPNQFELQLLSGRTVNSVVDGIEACNGLHELGTESVVVTSLEAEGFEDSIVVLASSNVPQIGCPTPFYIKLPKIEAYFTGCGDLLASLLLAHTAASPQDLATATEKACATLQEVLKNTAESAGELRNSSERTSQVMAARELKLVQSAPAILNPIVVHHAVPWEG